MGNQKSKPFSFVQDKNDNSADRYNVTRTRSEFYRRPPLDNPPRPEASSCEIRDFHNIGPHYVKSFDKIENTRPGSRKQFNEQVRADVARYTRHFATPDRQSRTKTSSSEKLDKEVVTSVSSATAHQRSLAFTVTFDEDKVRPTSRFQQEKEAKHYKDYTADERSLMAEIMRNTILAEKVAKASICGKRRQELLRRRQQILADERARQMQKMKDACPDPGERERRLKALAEKAKEARLLTKHSEKDDL